MLLNLGLIKYKNRDKKFYKYYFRKKNFLRSDLLILHSYKSYVNDLDKTLIKNIKLKKKCVRRKYHWKRINT